VTRDAGRRGRRLGTNGTKDADIELDETFVDGYIERGVGEEGWVKGGR